MNSVNKGNAADIIDSDSCKAVDLILHDILLKTALNKINVAYIKWMENLVTSSKSNYLMEEFLVCPEGFSLAAYHPMLLSMNQRVSIRTLLVKFVLRMKSRRR